MAWLCGFGQLRGPWGPRLISEISVSVRDSVWLQLSKRQWLKHRGQGKQPGAGRGALAFCLAVLSWASLHQERSTSKHGAFKKEGGRCRERGPGC